MTALYMLIGALLITAGYFLCYFTQKQPVKASTKEDSYIDVKRVKTSFKSPLNPTIVQYDKYKTTSGLYGAVVPDRNKPPQRVRSED